MRVLRWLAIESEMKRVAVTDPRLEPELRKCARSPYWTGKALAKAARKTLIKGREAWAWSNGPRTEIGVGWSPPEEPRTIYAVRTTLVDGQLVVEHMQAELEEAYA